MKSLVFKVRAGMTTPDGKPTWPASCRLEMTRQEALDLVVQLAHQAARSEEVSAFLVGKYEKDK